MTIETEIWRTPIYKGIIYENFKVSNLGRILSLNYRRTGRAELMTPCEDKDGYLQVGLSKNGKSDTCKVHRLVAETFLSTPDNLPCINHKIQGDEGKKINIVYINEDGTVDEEKSTIEWCTHEYNNTYGTRIERVAKAQSKPVLQFSKTGEFIREWPSTQECGRNGFNQGNICECCNGKRKSAHGYIWKYKE